MESFDGFLEMLDMMLNTQRKRHILGGLLMSASALFAGISVTVLTIKEDENAGYGN